MMYVGIEPFDKWVTLDTLLDNLPISQSTAYRWINNGTLPAIASELLTIKLTGKMIPNHKFWRDFRFCSNELWFDTKHCFSHAELSQVQYIRERSAVLNRHNNNLMEYINYLENIIPRAPVVVFPYNKTRPSLTADKKNNPLFKKP